MSHPRQISLIAGRRTISIPIEGLADSREVKMATRFSSSQGSRLRRPIYPESNGSSNCVQGNGDWVSAGGLRWRGYRFSLRSPRSSGCNYCNFQQSDK